jgi:hypothetical protein
MMKMITQTKGLNNFSLFTKQVLACFGFFLFLSASPVFGQELPVNDDPCGALPIACDQVIEGDATTATIGALDPTCAGGSLADLFYTFSADPGVTYTVTVNGDSYDGVLALYTGACDGELTEFACADNGFTTGVEEEIEFSVLEETEILIQTYNWSAGGGSFSLSLSCQVGFECPDLEANIGDPCTDNNEGTINDTVSENCECIGDAVPDNDSCENAPLLICGVSSNGSTASASPAPAGLPFCGTSSTTAPGVWFTYFALDNNPTIIDLFGSTYDTKLFVYTGLCGELECLTGNDDFGGLQSQVSFESVAGTYYYVFVTGFGSSSGDYTISINCGYDCDLLEAYIGDACDDLNSGTYDDVVTENCECVGIEYDCLELEANIGDACDDLNEGTENDTVNENCACIGTVIPDAPENDLACNATEIFCGDLIIGSNVAATNSASKCNGSTGGNDVWYSFTPEENMTVTLETCQEGTNFDTDLSVFTGSCDELVCFSGFGGNGHIDGSFSCEFASWASSGSFDAVAGVTYTIQLTGYGSSNSGDFALSISCVVGVDCPELGLNIGAACDDGNDNTIDDTVNADCGCVGIPVPENDLCENAIEINCGDLVTGNNSAASNTHPKCNGSTGGNDVWYSFTSDVNAVVYLENCLEGTNFDTDLSVFTGACDALECEPSFGGNGHIDGNSGCSFASWASGGEFVAVAGVEYTIQLTGFSASSQGDFAMSISCVEIFDCPELEANIGSPCDDGDEATENDIVDENCGCAGTPIVVNECEDWVMYLNNNAGGVTDIYGVDISSGDAVLEYITTVDYQAHIAYNPDNNLIYVLHNGNGSYVTVNPHTVVPEVSAPVFLSQDIPSITTAVFAPNGKLLAGSATENIIYSINIADQVVSVFDAYAPINGGDIAFDSSGMLYLATRSGNGLYQVYPDDVLADQLIGTLPSLVTGMALTESGKMLTSHNGNASLKLRNLDGSDAGVSYDLILDGAAFDHNNGDMASGCNTFQDNNEGDCDAFSTFYSHFGSGTGVSGSDLYRVSYSGTNANLELLTNVDFGAHIAYDGQNDIVYLVNPNGSFVRAYDPTAGIFLGDLPIVGDIDALYAVVYNDEDGLLYVGDANDDEIYSIDLVSGLATFVAEAPVNGGDLAIQDGKLYLADRSNEDLYEIVGGIAVLIGDIPAANGMAQANNPTGLIIANPGSSDFIEINAADGSFVQSFSVNVDGTPLILSDGDMAAGCSDTDSVEEIPNGDCNASELFDYTEGTTLSGGVLPAARSNSDQALGAPERTDAMVFTTLGYGGSITVGFNGAVPNGPGDDIEVVETSFNNPGCDSYPEFADVSVSMDGIAWFSAGTVCKGEPFVDISDAGDFDYVLYVRVSNIDDLTSTGDGFDVDGIVALHNCAEGAGIEENNVLEVAGLSTISSFPNPTSGPSQVVFVTAETGMALLEVYDMNGRNVSTLFNETAQAGMENRVDFNGTSLPNGIYIYKLTTNNETVINKFMIAR